MTFWSLLGLWGCVGAKLTCTEDTDCGEGICAPDGTCLYIEDTAGVDSGAVDTADTTDTTDTMDSNVCVPNLDGIIERSEYPYILDVAVPFFYGEQAVVDLVGTETNDHRTWDMSQRSSSVVDLSVQSVGAFWFADDFPNSTHVAVISHSNELYGIFTITDDGLWLDGVASVTEGWSQTLLRYEPSAPILRFPLQITDSWTSYSTVSGTLQGVYSWYQEQQTITVDAEGEMVLPSGTYPVLRLQGHTTKTIGVLTYQSYSMSFVTECYGTIVNAVSNIDETQAEFGTAMELLRLGL